MGHKTYPSRILLLKERAGVYFIQWRFGAVILTYDNQSKYERYVCAMFTTNTHSFRKGLSLQFLEISKAKQKTKQKREM